MKCLQAKRVNIGDARKMKKNTLAWAGLGGSKWSPGSPWLLEMKIHITAVLFRIDFLEGWPGLGWPGTLQLEPWSIGGIQNGPFLLP